MPPPRPDRLPERIDGDGVVLRRWRVEDAAAQHRAIHESLEHLRPWMPWVEEEPLTLEGRADTIAAWEREWASGGDAYLAILTPDGTIAGSAGLHRRVGPGGLEIGYWLHQAHTGRGLATAAVRALTAAALAHPGIDRVEIRHEPANVRSGAVPARLGFTALARQPDGDDAWRMTRDEWAARGAATYPDVAADRDTPRLQGRRILLTGASSGVGLETARLLHAEGARLALLARGGDALRDVVVEHGLDAVVLPVDLTDRPGVHRAVEEAAAQLGGIDIVVSNAAAAVFGHVTEVHPDDFDRTVAVTFTGAVNVIRAALPHLRASRGAIVATGSLMARVPLPTWAAYSSAKHALRGFLNSLYIEETEQGSGIDISMIHPGPIDTPLFAQASSATTRKPLVAPDAYASSVVAQALVEACVEPRREVMLGGETKLLDTMFAVARPAAELVLLLVDRWYRSGEEEAKVPGSLYTAPQHPQASGGIPARDSLLAPLQLGRRMLPSPSTPFRFAGHLGFAAVRAAKLGTALLRPVPERPAPTRSLADSPDAERPERAGTSPY